MTGSAPASADVAVKFVAERLSLYENRARQHVLLGWSCSRLPKGVGGLREALVRRWTFGGMRKLMKWEEVKEEGRWKIAPGGRAGGFMLSVFLELFRVLNTEFLS